MRYLRQNAADSWHGILLYIVGECYFAIFFSLSFIVIRAQCNNLRSKLLFMPYCSMYVNCQWAMSINGLKTFFLKNTIGNTFSAYP